MLGFKIFNNDWTCRDTQYRVGDVTVVEGPPVLCSHGLHFCATARECTDYYALHPNNRYAEVRAVGEIVSGGNKYATNKLEVVREISFKEFSALCREPRWSPITSDRDIDESAKQIELEREFCPHIIPVTEYYIDTACTRSECVYENGYLKRLSIYDIAGVCTLEIPFQRGRRHGVLIRRDPYGNKITEIMYVNGKRHGLATYWHVYNLTKQREIVYRSGLKVLETEWYPSGVKKIDVSYKRGEIDRISMLYPDMP